MSLAGAGVNCESPLHLMGYVTAVCHMFVLCCPPTVLLILPMFQLDVQLSCVALTSGVIQVRNSLLVAPMPTASTSQILGNNECFEPYTSNIYVRRVLSGEFTVVNQHLLHDLTRLGLWSTDIKNQLVAGNGSVQVSGYAHRFHPSTCEDATSQFLCINR